MPTSTPFQKTGKCAESGVDPTKKYLNSLIEPSFPENGPAAVKWGKSSPCKGGIYTWVSSPKTLSNQPKKNIKNNSKDSNQPYQNMMFDKRVIRGSNFNANAATISGELDHKDTAKRRQLLRKKPRNRIVGTPPPVRGRRHENVQTEKYLEELFVRPSENDVSCQTDLFLQRPPSAPFVATMAGRDAETEIQEGDLTHSDEDVQPVVDGLVGRCMEQAFLEVLHEEEVAEMKKEQQKLLALREAELEKLKRMENSKESPGKVKNRRITAAKLLQDHIADLLPAILSSIQSVTEAENREELERQLRPWLAHEVAEEIGHMIDSKELLGEIVKEILRERAEFYGTISESESEVSLAPDRKKNEIKSEDINDNTESVFIEGDEILYRRGEK
ncbi:radial spoke head protein 3 homolog B isoform X2 [Lutzomyia longipalpis]|uniref:radial spoke head protein 3 homolog B isoform X2 n=1 Tax=Lutzomyia longipalpis TaxID=7200 RepID=UPI002483A5E5|nr:radial spoke head protein 3 homolog B isoform X2 [Lutzomyia longipalpis]